MEHSNSSQLVVCSVMVAPARKLVLYKLRTWLDQIVKIVVHTFVVDESKVPLNPENPDGYWYCAGNFCNIDEAGVYQHLSRANIDYAKCLVAPNIKDEHPDREKLVISGQYGVHYVCHNITNRVLYSTENRNTLVDLDIMITGYEVVVKSVLGVYGQNKLEWERRKEKCTGRVKIIDSKKVEAPKTGAIEKAREEEIRKIHLKASGGDAAKAERLTYALQDIDHKFYLQTQDIVSEFDRKNINFDEYNSHMVRACATLFSETIREVGHDIAARVYPGCIIELEIENEFKAEKMHVATDG